MTLRVGNAPVSFGVFEPGFGKIRQMPWEQVLDAIAAAGYEGTELGPYGYLPTDAEVLRRELEGRRLGLASSFVPVRLDDPAALEAAKREVLTVGRLLCELGVPDVIVADEGDERRIALAGSGVAEPWSERQWAAVGRAFEVLASALKDELGMRIVVHHHAGTYLETPAEIDRLLAITEPGRVDLLLDTGHYVYGQGDPVELVEKHGARIRYLHYKDLDAAKLAVVRRDRVDMKIAWRQGVFVPLGRGCIDFPSLTEKLRAQGYDGWIIVEQDVIPDDETGRIDPDPLACARESREYLRGLGL
jgi:inosose dehydratase